MPLNVIWGFKSNFSQIVDWLNINLLADQIVNNQFPYFLFHCCPVKNLKKTYKAFKLFDIITKSSGIDLKSAVALKHDIRSERNQDGRPLISSTRGDFLILMIMYAVVLRHRY